MACPVPNKSRPAPLAAASGSRGVVAHRSSSARPLSTLGFRSSPNLGHQHPGLFPDNDEQLGTGTSAERDIDIDDSEEADAMNEVVMAVDLRDRTTVGCAYYVAREEKLYMMEDVKFGGIEIVEKSEEFATPYIVEVRPSSEFGFEAGKMKLASISLTKEGPCMSFIVPGNPEAFDSNTDSNELGHGSDHGNLLRLSGLVNLESQLGVGCAGAVLTYLQRRKAVLYLPRDMQCNLAFRVLSVETFSLSGIMFIDAETLSALQIMHSQTHPQSHNQGPSTSGSKEGLSVYGLFHHLARTPQGRYVLRQNFLRPTLDIEVINERLDTTAVFLRPDNRGLMDNLTRSLGQIKNMRTVMIRLRKGVSNGVGNVSGIKNSVWFSLRSFAFHALQVMDAISEMMGAESLQLTRKILENLNSRQLATIGRLVDFPSSAETHRTVVKPGVDGELDNMKRTYDGSEDLLSKTSQNIAETVPEQYNLDLNVIFFPQIGFLISMKRDPGTGQVAYEGPNTDNSGWDRIFSTGDRVYYKDFRMRELDGTLGDMYAIICDKEIEIIYHLSQEILQYEAMLTKASDTCGELDSLLALARGAAMYKLSRPRMTEDNVIRIKGGRYVYTAASHYNTNSISHPLQELIVPSYVSNDTSIIGGEGRGRSCGGDTDRSPAPSSTPSPSSQDQACMLMMTGPNYSGKSVYLKQVALIVFMAHVGCFVPADAAVIGITDKILTRVATKETITKVQSAFMLDLQQISKALGSATRRSLVFIDEFGVGTDSNDGAGLACGVFEHLLNLGEERPKVLGATHFHEIFENGFLLPRPYLAFGHMQVRIDEEAEAIEDQVTYLYKYDVDR
ncbi:MAG: hypothetical protein Q9219_005266 [cf. Caloplaca sp. 3 TL-2023]